MRDQASQVSHRHGGRPNRGKPVRRPRTRARMIEHSDGNPSVMSFFRRLGRLPALWGGISTTVFLVAVITADLVDAQAQDLRSDPGSAGNRKASPALELPPVAADPAATGSLDPGDKSLIDRALRGEAVDVPDSMLGDVVEIIRQRGSLLEGSELSKDLPPRVDSGHHAVPHRIGVSGPIAFPSPERLIKNLDLAEQLVATARLMIENAPHDPATERLVHQMLAHAARLIQPPPRPAH